MGRKVAPRAAEEAARAAAAGLRPAAAGLRPTPTPAARGWVVVGAALLLALGGVVVVLGVLWLLLFW